MSETSLAEAATRYLSRYASSSGNLRRLLVRKVRRSVAHYGDDPEPLLACVETLVARHAAAGAIDDRQFSDSQVRKLRRRGASARAILGHLGAKGVPRDIVDETAKSLAAPEDDRAAALAFAKRRRLGPFRTLDRAEHRQRDLAALGRAGFSYAVAVSVIDDSPPD
jgi:regulatory protein